MTGTGSVLLVEDDGLTADCVRCLLSTAGHVDVVIAASGREALEMFHAEAPGLVLLDLGLPDRDGVDLLRTLRAARFDGPILVLTSATDPERILAAMRAGADGYLFKDEIDVRLAAALRELWAGGAPMSAAAARVLLESLRQPLQAKVVPPLSPQERRVLEALATGASYAEIGRELAIAINTVRSHVRSVYDKLGVENRAEAVNLGWSFGLLNSGA